MAKSKTDGKARSACFKKGDWVSFPFGAGTITGQIIEDRGRLGIGGRRLYGIHIEINPGELSYTEMPEEELTPGTAEGPGE